MKKLRAKFGKTKIVLLLTSVKITTICLILLFILTFWGTVYQVKNGLYPAQEKFFNSFFFLGFNFFPFPGARLVMWVLFLNLVSVLIFRFAYKIKNLGILIIHFGILSMLLSAFVTFHFARESHVSLYEGEGTNVSASYNDWELAVWKTQGNDRDVIAFDESELKTGHSLHLREFNFTLLIKNYFAHCQAMTHNDGEHAKVINDSGIVHLEEKPASIDKTKNIPGIDLIVTTSDHQQLPILLFGNENGSTQVFINGSWYHLQLRHKTFLLPFIVKLIDFRMEKHPGTDVARSYESTVEIETPQMTRQSIISMNEPLRYKDYTFYQSSYAIHSIKGEMSTLAVVKNVGRVLPYIGTIITFLGLMVHFVVRFITTRKREKV